MKLIKTNKKQTFISNSSYGRFMNRPCMQILFVFAVMLVSACDNSPANSETPSAKSAMILTTDYSTGGVSTIDPDDETVIKNFQVVHSDTVCRFDEITKKYLIVSRFGADSITVLDPEKEWEIAKQYSVGAGTSAHDIAVVSQDRAYVTRNGDSNLLTVNPLTGEEIEKIDLKDYADDDDVPEASGIVHVDGEIFVALGRLDSTNQFMPPTEFSSVIVINADDGVVKKEVKLTGKNPYGKLRYNKSLKKIIMIEVGTFGVLDGGIEYLDPETHELSGFKVTEETLGGDLSDAVIVSETKGYAVIGTADFKTKLVSFNPLTGQKIKDVVSSAGWDLAFIEATPDGKELWVADRVADKPGIRIFDTLDDSEITELALDVGLPPFMVCFVK